jgi:MFS family permease
MPQLGWRPSDLTLVVGASLATSTTGGVALLALALRLSATGSSWAVAGLWLAGTAPAVLLAPFTGLLLDRVETVGVMRQLAVLGAAADVGLALAPGVGWVLALAAVLGATTAASAPGMLAIAGSLGGEQGPAARNEARSLTRIQASQWAGATLGPLLGAGLVLAWGTRTPLLVDAGALLLLAGGLRLVRARRHPQPSSRDGSWGAELAAGARLLVDDGMLRRLMPPVALVVSFVNVAVVAEVFLATRAFHSGPLGYGALVAAWGGGLVLGTLSVPRLLGRRPLLLTGLGAALAAVGLAGAGISPGLGPAVLAYLVGGFGNGLEMNSARVLVQRRAPAGTLGRAFAAYFAVGSGSAAVGAVCGGALLGAVGSRGAMEVAALAVASAALWLVFLSRFGAGAGARRAPTR